jgi:ABC-2 type transport system permease protein
MYWSVRRELWENRSIYIAPLAVAALFLFGFLINVMHLPGKMRTAVALTPMEQHELSEEPFALVALLLMGTTFIVSVFYCLDALYGERRDRSILFWKSLPVSDLTTVLSKACIPLLILPLLTFAITVVTQWIMLLISSAVLLGSGLSATTLFSQLSFFQMSMILLNHLVGVHALWYAPIYGWLLLVSAWARRAPFLWATLPLFAVGILEKIAFNTSHFADLVGSRFGAGGEDAGSKAMGMMAMLGQPDAEKLLSSPGLWIGLGVSALFLAAAVRLRRNREPI